MSENSGDNTDFRDNRGRFVKGNPGKPVGARNKLPKITMKRIEAMGDAALEQLWAAIHRSESWAIQLVLQKILPADRMVEFENFTPDDLKEALSNGDISGSEAKALCAVLRDLAEVESLDEIKARLAELEQHVREDE